MSRKKVYTVTSTLLVSVDDGVEVVESDCGNPNGFVTEDGRQFLPEIYFYDEQTSKAIGPALVSAYGIEIVGYEDTRIELFDL